MDLLVSSQGSYDNVSGNQKSKIAYYENTGTSTPPEFSFVTDDYQNISLLGISTQLNFYPTFSDLDDDGDSDMILGEYSGYLYYFSNTGGAGNPAIFGSYTILKTSDDNPIIDGIYPIPQLVDIDRDGDFDLVLGKRNGKLNFYENTGTASSYQFELQSSEFGGVHVTQTGFVEGRAVPIFVEIDNKYKLIVGSQDGFIRFYDQIEENINGDFQLFSSALDQINIGKNSAPTIANINNSDYFTLILGNKRGGVGYYESVPFSKIGFDEKESFTVNVYPNPTNSEINVLITENSGLKTKVNIVDLSGRNIYENDFYNETVSINVNHFESGVYLMKIEVNNIITTKKIVINHE
jgi:hypothetical protein